MKKYVLRLVKEVNDKDPARAEFLKANIGPKFVQPMLKKFVDNQLRTFVVEDDKYEGEGPIILFEQDGADGLEQPKTKFWLYVLCDSLAEENC